jgi:hypothetical protein
MGATDDQVQCMSFPAGAALTAADRGKWVKLNATNQVILCTADTDITVGVLYGNLPAPNVGDAVTVAYAGKAMVLNGATLANSGVLVAPDATARNQAAVAGDRAAGLLCTAGMAAGEFAEVIIRPTGSLIA